MQGEHRPFFPCKQFIPEHISDKIDNKKDHYRFKPSGVIHPNSSGFGAILAFYKSADTHGKRKHQKQNSH